jgi:transketolase
MLDAFVASIVRHTRSDPRVVLFYADCGPPSLVAAAERSPGQFLNVGIAECALVGVAAGAAAAGIRPVAFSMASFLLPRAYEHIRNLIATVGANVKLVGMGGGLALGPLGASHQSPEDLGLALLLPNLVVACPTEAAEVDSIVDTMFEDDHPWYLRLHRNGPVLTREGTTPRPVPRDHLRLWRRGRDLLLVTSGPLVFTLLEAATELERDGIDAGVASVTLLTQRAIDALVRELASVAEVLVVEDHLEMGGLRALLEAHQFPRRLHGIGIHETRDLGAPEDDLRAEFGLDVEHVVACAKAVTGHDGCVARRG